MLESKAVGEKWVEKLKTGGYEHALTDKKECRNLKKLPRIWRRILKAVEININNFENKSIFEVGCGGGKHLMPFVMRGWKAVGIDVSDEVLKRAEEFFDSAKDKCGIEENIDFVAGDFFDYESSNRYDLVFHAGVIEHFLNDSERLEFLQKMFQIVKPGGYVISIVPNGIHPLRAKMKEQKLGGYDIPEIDYSPELMTREFISCGAENVRILAHNLFNHFLIDNKRSLVKKLIFYKFQLIPAFLLPKKFSCGKAGALIAVGRKPKN